MALGSAITILKMAVLAAVFPATEFANYASAFALVGIVANLVSFGLTDGLVKRYVRLFEFSRLPELERAIWDNSSTLFKRTILASVVMIPICWFYFGSENITASIAIMTLALASNIFTIISALFLGLKRQNGMAFASLLRAILALTIVTAFGVAFGWRAGFLLEAISTTIVGVCFLFYLRLEVVKSEVHSTPEVERYVSGDRDGFWLFIAYTAALIPLSFDRIWVTSHSTAWSSAQYAFAAIWISAGYTVCAIYTQKFGPDIVRSQTSEVNSSLLKTACWHSAAVGFLVLVMSLGSFFLLYILFREVYWEKFNLSATLTIIISLVSAIQITRIFDWALISIDGESGVMVSNIIFAGMAILLFAICAMLQANASMYLFAFGGSRVTQILVTAAWLHRLDNREKR